MLPARLFECRIHRFLLTRSKFRYLNTSPKFLSVAPIQPHVQRRRYHAAHEWSKISHSRSETSRNSTCILSISFLTWRQIRGRTDVYKGWQSLPSTIKCMCFSKTLGTPFTKVDRQTQFWWYSGSHLMYFKWWYCSPNSCVWYLFLYQFLNYPAVNCIVVIMD